MNLTRYRAGDRRYLAVDAEQYVPDRAAFAARHCDPGDGVAPPDDDVGKPEVGGVDGRVHVDQSVSGPRGGPGVAADGGPGRAETGRPTGADGVLFLALEPDFTPPRVVMTVVHPDGGRTPCCTRGIRCAARWAARRTDARRVMVDTQAGTRAARIHDDGSVSVEVADAGDGRDVDDVETERGPVVHEFGTEVQKPTP